MNVQKNCEELISVRFFNIILVKMSLFWVHLIKTGNFSRKEYVEAISSEQTSVKNYYMNVQKNCEELISVRFFNIILVKMSLFWVHLIKTGNFCVVKNIGVPP